MPLNEVQDHDYIIVGAGAAGCVLAGRITEDPARRVLLIEAGADHEPDKEHPSIRDPYPVSFNDPQFSWPNFIAEVGADPGEGRARFSRAYLQGRGVGGGSNILGMVAFRGVPDDYDEWSRMGAAGWGWDDVLPYFCKLEHDLDFGGTLHGQTGPMPVRRIKRNEAAPFSRAMAQAFHDRGYPYIEDLNGDFRDGVGPVPMSNMPDRRVSAAMAYLNAEVRRRPNLSILSQCVVERVVVHNARAEGVVVRLGSEKRTLKAREIILSAGALRSPEILMRSGIGPAAHLREHGIEVVRDLPGVGARLMNHPEVTVATHLKSRAVQPDTQRGGWQSCLRFSSGLPDCPEQDMLLTTINKGSWHALGRRIGAVGVSVYRSFSLGEVRLRSADPATAPAIRFNLLSDPRDRIRLVAGLKLLLEALASPGPKAERNQVFLPNGAMVKALGRRTPWNAFRAAGISALFDSSVLRGMMLGSSVLDLPALINGDPAALDILVSQRAGPVHHVCGTCRMGKIDDPGTVVDPECRVVGIAGLRVVDGSIMPTMVRANTHFPILMIGEKAADTIRRNA